LKRIRAKLSERGVLRITTRGAKKKGETRGAAVSWIYEWLAHPGDRVEIGICNSRLGGLSDLHMKNEGDRPEIPLLKRRTWGRSLAHTCPEVWGALVAIGGVPAWEGNRPSGKAECSRVFAFLRREPKISVRAIQKGVTTRRMCCLVPRKQGQRPVQKEGGKSWGFAEKPFCGGLYARTNHATAYRVQVKERKEGFA